MPEYEIENTDGIINVEQKKDSVSARIWQQSMAVKWLGDDEYRDTVIELKNATPKTIKPKSLKYVFPNADGASYGYFKMDTASVSYFIRTYNQTGDTTTANPVFRGSMLVNQWECFVRGDGVPSQSYLDNLCEVLPKEMNPLLVDYLLGNLQGIWWTFLSDAGRKENQQRIEKLLWGLLEKTTDKGVKTSYFRAFRSVAMTENGLLKVRSLWDSSLVVKDLILSEDDRIALAYELALKGKEGKMILEKQLADTKNPDRKARMRFVIPALNGDETIRDAFFESLKKEENREKEAWVLDALSYLHHPLRQKSALKYLRPSLEMLQEIQLTGDIFFPTRWTHNTFSGHSSKEASDIAASFLKAKPDYPFFLKNKILQATDMLDRAVRLKK